LFAFTAAQTPVAVAEPALRSELIQLGRDDQAAREGLADAIKSNNALFAETGEPRTSSERRGKSI
jgi:hypothetical protein